MRVILDTNVFISGIFFSGPPSKILREWANQSFQIVLTQEILEEYKRVANSLSSKFQSLDIMPIIELVTINGLFVDTQACYIAICDDPDDDKFIECAICGNCDIIVSGDKHVLKLTGYSGISILQPRNFVEKFLD